jgi:hypothetical protein
MSKSIRIQVPQPCHENWNHMNPAEQGRFCLSCSKTVVDFSLMSDKELLEYMAGAGSHVCGRFSGDQVNRDLLPPPARKHSWRYAWQLLLAGLLVTAKAGAQQAKKPGVTLAVHKDKPARPMIMGGIRMATVEETGFVEGVVLDSATRLPVAYAYLRIGATGKSVSVDSSGRFRISKEDLDNTFALEISSVGYTTRKVTLDAGSFMQRQMNIYLSQSTATLGEVVVIGYATRRRRDIMGVTTTTTRDTVWTTLNKFISDSLSFIGIHPRAMTVYPNPASPGSVVKLSLQLPETGRYTLDLFDRAGVLVQSKSIELANPSQVELLQIPARLARGLYVVRLSRPGAGKTYAQKLALQ